VQNVGLSSLVDVRVDDLLPTGIRYLQGSALLDGAPITDPSGSPGPALNFALGTLAAGNTVVLTYRAELGAGVELGTRVNLAVANSPGSTPGPTRPVSSNASTAEVRLIEGVFTDEGLIAGKVFMDCACDSNRTQKVEEPGIPGVRVTLEDGTWSVTDAEGKYHFDHVRPRLHVVRVDFTTLPEGTRPMTLTNRHAQDGLSQFVDLQKGEFARADFAVARDTMVQRLLRERRTLGEPDYALSNKPPAGVDTLSLAKLRPEITNRSAGVLEANGRSLLALAVVAPASTTGRTWTAESDGGRWVSAASRTADADDATAGAQFRHGVASQLASLPVLLQRPDQPGEVRIRLSADGYADSGLVNFVPERRSLLLAGLLEGRLDWRKRRSSEIDGSRDRFEDELKDASFEGSDGRLTGAARGALYMKGTVAHVYSLTARYDSEQDPNQRLFRDIRPLEGYDVFGDAGSPRFDAQSTSRIYARVDRGGSFGMY
jgi:hypothetical protein